jgi:hypothetical protein
MVDLERDVNQSITQRIQRRQPVGDDVAERIERELLAHRRRVDESDLHGVRRHIRRVAVDEGGIPPAESLHCDLIAVITDTNRVLQDCRSQCGPRHNHTIHV